MNVLPQVSKNSAPSKREAPGSSVEARIASGDEALEFNVTLKDRLKEAEEIGGLQAQLGALAAQPHAMPEKVVDSKVPLVEDSQDLSKPTALALKVGQPGTEPGQSLSSEAMKMASGVAKNGVQLDFVGNGVSGLETSGSLNAMSIASEGLAESLEEGDGAHGIDHDPKVFGQDQSVSDLLSHPDLNVKGVEVKALRGSNPERKATELGLPSRVSTEDFLSLRDLKKEKSTKAQTGSAVESTLNSVVLKQGPLHLGPSVSAPVTEGTAGRVILSQDAIHQITQQVNLLSKAKQDGEIKIRLRPDHLGELMMHVKANGQQVSIQIKTEHPEAKRIIEESLGQLKDSLSVQNLDLGRVDVVTQPNASQASDAGLQMDLGQGQAGFGRGDAQRHSDSSGNARQEFLFEDRAGSSNLKPMGAVRASRTALSGGLDLIA